jgi:hypothetical protein
VLARVGGDLADISATQAFDRLQLHSS